MAGIEDVREHIRFCLAELGERNDHHCFERLCREFARLRICRNLLPATGPVSAGGDQGRDFETFRTYLNSCGLDSSAFLGIATPKVLVFACSVQKNRLASKIAADLRKIMTGGQRPDCVYFFSAVGVNVAERHKAQAAAKKKHRVDLEIIDRQALSEELSSLELFWIAKEYLHIPAEIYPPLPADPTREKYEAFKREWVSREPRPESFSDFEELKQGIRRASRDSALRGDVAFFSKRLQTFRSSPIATLRRRAVYEDIVAQLYAYNDLRGREQDVSEYFAADIDLAQPAQVRDAMALLLFVEGALKRTVIEVARSEFAIWRDRFLSQVDEELRDDSSASRLQRCILLEVRGTLSLVSSSGPVNLPAIDEAVRCWRKLLELVEAAPLYPLESFGRYVTEMVVVVGHHPEYRSLARELDVLVSKRVSKRTAAENAWRRSRLLEEAGRKRESIEELHAAKVDWYDAETLSLSAASMLAISRWYGALGLSSAAKYYAMAAAYVISRSEDHDVLKMLPEAVLAVADQEYLAGAWANFFVWAKASLPLLGGLASIAEVTEHANRLAFHGFTALNVCELFGLESLTPPVRKFLDTIGFSESQEEILARARKRWPTREEFIKSARQELTGPFFGDACTVRHVRWKALGIEWTVRFQNEHDTATAAEELIGLLQVILADLSRIDLGLLPTRVSILLQTEDGRCQPQFKRMPTNECSDWQVLVPSRGILIDKEKALFSGCTGILREISLLPDEEFIAALRTSFERGLAAKVFVARPYRELTEAFVSEMDFVEFPRNQPEPPDSSASLTEHDELAWFSATRPDYDRKATERITERRYEGAFRVVRATLPRLRSDPQFRVDVGRLQSEGWKDWHILMAVAALATNERFSQKNGNSAVLDDRREFWAMLDREETDEDPPLPESLFRYAGLRRQILLNMVSSARGMGLSCHQVTPDLEAIRVFLAKRYRYLEDDVPHAPLI